LTTLLARQLVEWASLHDASDDIIDIGEVFVLCTVGPCTAADDVIPQFVLN